MLHLVKEYEIRRMIIKDFDAIDSKLWQAMTRVSINGKLGPWVALPVAMYVAKASAGQRIAENRVKMRTIEPVGDCILELKPGISDCDPITHNVNPNGLM